MIKRLPKNEEAQLFRFMWEEYYDRLEYYNKMQSQELGPDVILGTLVSEPLLMTQYILYLRCNVTFSKFDYRYWVHYTHFNVSHEVFYGISCDREIYHRLREHNNGYRPTSLRSYEKLIKDQST